MCIYIRIYMYVHTCIYAYAHTYIGLMIYAFSKINTRVKLKVAAFVCWENSFTTTIAISFSI